MKKIFEEYFVRRAIENWYDAYVKEFGEDKDHMETRLIEIIDEATEGKIELSR